MAIYTQLSPAATPGKPYSFTPKAAAGSGPHTGLFTALSPMALPGTTHSFLAKGGVPVPVPLAPTLYDIGGGGYQAPREPYIDVEYSKYLRELRDRKKFDELTEIIQIITMSGVLDD